jgi:hypothetical protein
MNLFEILITLSIVAGVAYMTFETSEQVKNQYEDFQLQQSNYIKKI